MKWQYKIALGSSVLPFHGRYALRASRLNVSLTNNLIFINGQFLQRHWASRMQTVGAYTDLGSETEFCSIIKSGGCIPNTAAESTLFRNSVAACSSFVTM